MKGCGRAFLTSDASMHLQRQTEVKEHDISMQELEPAQKPAEECDISMQVLEQRLRLLLVVVR